MSNLSNPEEGGRGSTKLKTSKSDVVVQSTIPGRILKVRLPRCERSHPQGARRDGEAPKSWTSFRGGLRSAWLWRGVLRPALQDVSPRSGAAKTPGGGERSSAESAGGLSSARARRALRSKPRPELLIPPPGGAPSPAPPPSFLTCARSLRLPPRRSGAGPEPARPVSRRSGRGARRVLPRSAAPRGPSMSARHPALGLLLLLLLLCPAQVSGFQSPGRAGRDAAGPCGGSGDPGRGS